MKEAQHRQEGRGSNSQGTRGFRMTSEADESPRSKSKAYISGSDEEKDDIPAAGPANGRAVVKGSVSHEDRGMEVDGSPTPPVAAGASDQDV